MLIQRINYCSFSCLLSDKIKYITNRIVFANRTVQRIKFQQYPQNYRCVKIESRPTNCWAKAYIAKPADHFILVDDYHTKDQKTTLRLESLERAVISRVESGPLAFLCGSLYLSLMYGPKLLVNIVVFQTSVLPSMSYDILNIFLYVFQDVIQVQ